MKKDTRLTRPTVTECNTKMYTSEMSKCWTSLQFPLRLTLSSLSSSSLHNGLVPPIPSTLISYSYSIYLPLLFVPPPLIQFRIFSVVSPSFSHPDVFVSSPPTQPLSPHLQRNHSSKVIYRPTSFFLSLFDLCICTFPSYIALSSTQH